RRVIWSRSNLDQLDGIDGISLENRWGFKVLREFAEPEPGSVPPGTLPDFFSMVYYKNQAFKQAAGYINGELNVDAAMLAVQVTDAGKTRVHAVIGNPATKETAPYVLQSGNFWFVADLPLNNIAPTDRYVVFSDLLHDMLGIDHTEGRRAMVRLE